MGFRAEYVVYPLLWIYVGFNFAKIHLKMYKNREVPAVKKFNPDLITQAHFVMVLNFVWTSILCMFSDVFSYKIAVLIIVIGAGVMIGSVCFALFKYYVHFFLTEQRMEVFRQLSRQLTQKAAMDLERTVSLEESIKVGSQNFLKKWVSSERNHWSTITVTTVLIMLPHFIIVFTGGQSFYDAKLSTTDFSSNAVDSDWIIISLIVVIIQATVITGFIGTLYYKMRKLRKDQDIRNMVGILAVLAVYITIATVISFQTPVIRVRIQKFDFSSFLVWVPPLEMTFWFFRLRSHLFKSFGSEETVSSDCKVVTFQTFSYENLTQAMKIVLHNPEGNCLVLEISRNEFWVEAVLFWNTAQIWKSSTFELRIKPFAEEISKIYVEPGSVCEINISSACRTHILEAIKHSSEKAQMSENLFDEALVEVDNLILTHIGTHLMKKPEFRKILSEQSTPS